MVASGKSGKLLACDPFVIHGITADVTPRIALAKNIPLRQSSSDTCNLLKLLADMLCLCIVQR